jgi:hypothetical protein
MMQRQKQFPKDRVGVVGLFRAGLVLLCLSLCSNERPQAPATEVGGLSGERLSEFQSETNTLEINLLIDGNYLLHPPFGALITVSEF